MKGFDKKGWKKVTFGDVCRNLNVSETKPLQNGLDRYVGLEHIESDSLHIKTWGNVAEGTTFTKTFKPGQVLFGKRRAYLKKAAVADFAGLCSGDILVFEAIEKVMDPTLLPFLVSSERFFEYAVKTSAGSLSPRTKFQDLAKFEFLLPPKDQQKKLAELLWAGDEVVERYVSVDGNLKKIQNDFVDLRLFFTDGDKKKRNTVKLIDCLKRKPKYGANASAIPYIAGKPRYVRITDINDEGELIATDCVSIDSENYDEYILGTGDFLFARTGNTVGKTFLYRNEYGPSVYAGYLIKVTLNNDSLLPETLELICKSTTYSRFLKSVVKVGAQPNINAEQYSNMRVPEIPISEQKQILKEHDLIRRGFQKVRNSLLKQRQIQAQLINQIFSN